jgi:hypothetical protein
MNIGAILFYSAKASANSLELRWQGEKITQPKWVRVVLNCALAKRRRIEVATSEPVLGC